MSDDAAPRFDPRFDPAFQRGFDGTGATATPSTLKPPVEAPPAWPLGGMRAAGESVLPESPLATARPAQSAPQARAAAAPVTARVAPDSVAAPATDDTDPGAVVVVESGFGAEEGSSASSPLRNPFLVVLGVAAAALVAVGLWLFQRSGAAFNDPGNIRSQGDYMTLQATLNMAPLLITLGVATALGVLFLFAVRWRR